MTIGRGAARCPMALAASSPKTARSCDAATRREPRMIAKLLLQNLIWIVGMGALLFVPAGTLHWTAAWVFLATIGFLGIAGGLWLARTDPALLAERMRPMMQRDQPAADKTFMLVFGFAALIWFVAIGLDRRRHGLRHPDGAAGAGACDAAVLHRLHHVGDAREFVRSPRDQAADRTRPPRGLHRPLRLCPASHVQRRRPVLRRRAAAAGLVVGRGDVAAVRRPVRDPLVHRGTHADRGPAGLCRLHRAGALPAGARVW